MKRLDDLLLDSEEILLEVTPFKGPLIVPAILTIIFLVGSLVLIDYLPTSAPYWIGILLGIPFVISALWLLVRSIKLKSTKYVITNQRVMSISGVISKNIRDIPLSKIQSVSYHQGILGRIFNIGSVVIESAGLDPNAQELLNLIHNPKAVYKQLRSLTR